MDSGKDKNNKNAGNEKPDWIIHQVIDSWNEAPDSMMLNAHTHGLEKYGHMDFQVVLNCEDKLVGYILNAFGYRVRNGEKFNDGDMVDGIFSEVPVKLLKTIEGGRELLRVIIPDNEGRFPGDPECADVYRLQEIPMFLGEDPPEGWYGNEFELYRAVISSMNVDECGWVSGGSDDGSDEFCIWVPYASVGNMMDVLKSVYGNNAFLAPGIAALAQADDLVLVLSDIEDADVDLEKIFPKDMFRH